MTMTMTMATTKTNSSTRREDEESSGYDESPRTIIYNNICARVGLFGVEHLWKARDIVFPVNDLDGSIATNFAFFLAKTRSLNRLTLISTSRKSPSAKIGVRILCRILSGLVCRSSPIDLQCRYLDLQGCEDGDEYSYQTDLEILSHTVAASFLSFIRLVQCSDPMFEVILRGLTRNKRLQRCILPGPRLMGCPRIGKLLGQMINSNSSLKELHIEDVTFDELVNMAGSSTKNSSLTKISLRAPNLPYQNMTRVNMGPFLLAVIISNTESLVSLCLSGFHFRLMERGIGSQRSSDEWAVLHEAIRTHPCLRELRLCSVMVSRPSDLSRTSKALAQLLDYNKFEKISLHGFEKSPESFGHDLVGLWDDQIVTLFEKLRTDTTLRCLALEVSSLGDGTWKVITEALRDNRTLRELRLVCLQSLSDSTIRMAQALLNCRSPLKVLDLHNFPMETESVRLLLEAVKDVGTITELHLRSQRLTEGGMESLCRLLPDLKQLTSLTFQWPTFQSRDFESDFLDALYKHQHLVKLKLAFAPQDIADEAGTLIVRNRTNSILRESLETPEAVLPRILAHTQPSSFYQCFRKFPLKWKG